MRNKNIYKKVQITLHNYKEEEFSSHRNHNQQNAYLTLRVSSFEIVLQDIQTELLTAENKKIEEYNKLKYP